MNIFNTISNLIKELGNSITWEYLLYGGVGLTLLLIIFMFFRTKNTYEVKMLHSVNKLNKYFASNPFINDDNIVEINDKFKRVPHAFRYAWQQYMLNRDKVPSEYMNTITCLDQPLKASAHKNSATVTSIITGLIAGIALFFGFAINYAVPPTDLVEGIFKAAITPVLAILLGQLFVIFLRARNTVITADLYTHFHTFESYINKACTTMPAYIDYEVLFTKKEIKDGIPALQEYLEKRALQEQKDREDAALVGDNFEKFNFDDLGVENALLLERAMVESEKFFNAKHSLTEQITAKEQEMFNFQKNFDEVTKDFERKAQAVRESLKQLNDQLNATTVNIEANYIKKRYKEDQQKLQQLEKDYEIASIRFNKQQQDLQNEIDSLKAEIERRKNEVQKAMLAEGKSYANKIYGQLNAAVVDQNQPLIDEQTAKLNELENQLQDLTKHYEDTQIELNNTQTMLDTAKDELQVKQAEIEGISNLRDYLSSPEFKQRVTSGAPAADSKHQSNKSVNFELEQWRKSAMQAEEQLRIANERAMQMEKQQAELINKLNQLEQDKQPKPAAPKENAKGNVAMAAKAKRDAELAELNKQIMAENNAIKQTQTKPETNKEPETAKPVKKTTLADLVNQAKKVEKKDKK